MAKIRGRDLALHVARGSAPSTLNDPDQYTLVGNITSRSYDRSRNAIDVSSAASGDDMDYLGGRRSRTLTMEGYFDAVHDSGYAILNSAMEAAGTDSIWWILATGTSGDKIIYGRGIVTELSITGEDDGAVTFTCTINITGKPLEATAT